MPGGGDRTAREVAAEVATRAEHRDRAASARDARARQVDDALIADPEAYDAEEVARLAARDRGAAEDDRAAAAGDRGRLVRALLRDDGAPADGSPPGAGVDLRPREREVLERLARGLTAREIATDLYLSVNTVKTHTRNLYAKIGVTSRVAAANWARDNL